MFKKRKEEDKVQKLNKIILKFNQIKSTVMTLKKVSKLILILNIYNIINIEQ